LYSRNCEDWDLSPIYTHTPFVVRGGNGTRYKEDMIVPSSNIVGGDRSLPPAQCTLTAPPSQYLE
jgi:hypothetical protein